MGLVRPIERLLGDARSAFPGLRSELEPDGSGAWWLDLWHEDHWVSVEWRPHVGFGISARPDVGLGEGPDEVHRTLEQARSRVLELLRTGTSTDASGPVTIEGLRRTRGVTQTDLAAALGLHQANLARLERRPDLRLSTLASLVEALGGELSLRARFPDGSERELRLPAPPERTS
jgi:DNA-binding Xre family transcriptional regulator